MVIQSSPKFWRCSDLFCKFFQDCIYSLSTSVRHRAKYDGAGDPSESSSSCSVQSCQWSESLAQSRELLSHASTSNCAETACTLLRKIHLLGYLIGLHTHAEKKRLGRTCLESCGHGSTVDGESHQPRSYLPYRFLLIGMQRQLTAYGLVHHRYQNLPQASGSLFKAVPSRLQVPPSPPQ